MADSNYQPVTLTDLCQYANSTGHRVYCYAELAVSSAVRAKTTASTHCTYPQKDGQAEWAWVSWKNTEMVDPPKVVINPSTNQARYTLTSLIWPMPLPLYETSQDSNSFSMETVYDRLICKQGRWLGLGLACTVSHTERMPVQGGHGKMWTAGRTMSKRSLV